jgi:ABC-type Zn2+ transport system substrate-binding protein/surface adhesin
MSTTSSVKKFLGLGRKAAASTETEEEKKKREEEEAKKGKKAKTSDDDEDEDEDEDEDDEDEDEDEGDDEDGRKAIRQRNALRAAGHRRGVAAEQSRLATIFNDLDPGKVEMALHLALGPATAAAPAELIRAQLDKMPAAAGARTPFAGAMDQIARSLEQPGFGADRSAGGKPSLSGRMAETLKSMGRTSAS